MCTTSVQSKINLILLCNHRDAVIILEFELDFFFFKFESYMEDRKIKTIVFTEGICLLTGCEAKFSIICFPSEN